MFSLPQLLEEDMRQMEAALGELIAKSEATLALVIDKGGFVLASQGAAEHFDTTTLAALAAGSYSSNEAIASLIQEPNFCSVYQQGENLSLLVNNVDEHCLLVVVFKGHLSVGAVKYYAAPTIRKIATQLQTAHQRAPSEGLNLALMNLGDPAAVLRKKSSG
jgi:predicted regulator of Ras-like GTPase activity (Roadblock/LC7/MglB family)